MRVFLVLWVGIALTASSCAPSTQDLTETSIAATDGLPGVQTSVAATAPTAPSLTSVPTWTPVPSPSIPPSPTLPAGLAEAKLRPGDLPPQFEQLDPEEWGFVDPNTSASATGRIMGKAQVFMDPSTRHLITIQSSFLAAELHRERFDEMTSSTDNLIEEVTATFPPGVDIQSFPLILPSDLGEVRVGATLLLPGGDIGPNSRQDAIAFRRGFIAVEIFTIYLENATVAVTAVEIALIIDTRLLEAEG